MLSNKSKLSLDINVKNNVITWLIEIKKIFNFDFEIIYQVIYILDIIS